VIVILCRSPKRARPRHALERHHTIATAAKARCTQIATDAVLQASLS